MPFSRAIELFEYWENSPPPAEMLHIITAAYTDWKPRLNRSTTAEEAQDAVLQMGGAVHDASQLPEWMRVSLAAYEHQPQTVN